MKFHEFETNKDIVIWGTKREGILLAMLLEENGIEIKDFCDNNETVWGKQIYKEKKCISPQNLKKDIFVLIAVRTEKVEKEIAEQLDLLKIEHGEGLQNIINEYWKTVEDEKYLKSIYFVNTRQKLNLEHPKSFNEKLQWLKLYDRKPEYNILVDKYEVKNYVASLIGEQYIIPTLGIWNKYEEIDFDSLPEKFALKCTHDSGSCIICNNKTLLDLKMVKEKITRCLSTNPYYATREWPYKDVKPRIIAEELLMDTSEKTIPSDYKFFCFSGEPKVIMTVVGGHDDETKVVRRMYDMNWNLLDIGLHGQESVKVAEVKPKGFNEMYQLARKLSQGFIHIRVDFYYVENKIYFGEMTFYHMSGYEIFKPDRWNDKLGEFIKLFPVNEVYNEK